MLIVQNLSYTHPNKDLLFSGINLSVNNHDKIALIGNNGSGKSTLLNIIAGRLKPAEGNIQTDTEPYYVPQIFGQYNHLTIAQALGVSEKLNALKEIIQGNATEGLFAQLGDDWTIEERCQDAMKYWKLFDLDLSQKLETLSGGQKTKIFLVGIIIHQPDFILLDEPSNHLDTASRELLYDFIQHTKTTLIVVSHDRALLNLLPTVCELNQDGVTIYGGNYDFYTEQKQLENNALNNDIRSREKALRKAKEKERETAERQQKLDARGKKKQEKSGVARIMMNTLRNSAENSTAKSRSMHTEKIGSIAGQLHELRINLPDTDKMNFGFDDSALHKGKILCTGKDVNFGYHKLLWKQDLNFRITSGDRVALKGLNGSGKTTLIKLITGMLPPTRGIITSANYRSVYIDQDYAFIDNGLNIYAQAQQYNNADLQEHEIKTRLNRFLFTKEDWEKPCSALSGGERMRLMLCCLTITNVAPDMIILDEPNNNLDIRNIEILTTAIREYQGTLIVISHDERFLEEINVTALFEL